MKFKFSLEPVLKVREHEEMLQKQKLAEELSKKKEMSHRQGEMKKKLQNYLQNRGSEEFESIHTVRRHNKHVQQIHQQMNELGKKLEEVEEAVNDERGKLAEVHKKRHIMEKVKEVEQKQFAEKLARYEQKVMDEIATQAHSH